MAVGIEERMVPHMENKKQDCKKIEELKRQYAGSEMSGEQVEQMKTDRGSKDGKRNESRKMHTVRKYCGSGCCSGGSSWCCRTPGERGVCHGESTGGRKTRGGCVTFRDYQYDNGGHAADIKTPELTVKESDTEQMTDTEVQVQENLKNNGRDQCRD